MAEPVTIERFAVLAGAAGHIRKHYGDRLAELYVLPQRSYPDCDDEDVEIDELHLVAILNPPVDVFDEFEFTASLTGMLFEQHGFYVTTHIAKPASELATLTRDEGVRL
jgi:hypothetical protein